MEILIILLLMIINGVFAMSELAVASARKTRLEQMSEEGNPRARTALELAKNPNRFLSTVQIGITLIGILAGAFGGATVAGNLEEPLRQIEPLADYSQPLAFGLVVLFTTYLSLVVGELVPKRLALLNPERVAVLVAQPMRWLSIIASPLVSLLSFSTESLLRIMGIRVLAGPDVTEDDIRALMRQGAREGVFAEEEEDMVVNVFRLDDVRVDAIMTPRTEIVWLDLEDPVEDNIRKITTTEHSYFPVCREDLDRVVGVLKAKALLGQQTSGAAIDLESLLFTPLFLPEVLSLSSVLKAFKRSGKHMALVISEHGGIEGMVTINDIMEEIVGDVDQEDPQVITREDGSLLVDGMLSVHRLRDVLQVESLPGDEEVDYQTLGGFVMDYLGKVPHAADFFEWAGLRFEVMDMDGNRVDKVLIQKLEVDSTASDSAEKH